MGGDDLGSDDEFFLKATTAPAAAPGVDDDEDSSTGSNAPASGEEEGAAAAAADDDETNNGRKRKVPSSVAGDDSPSPNKKKRGDEDGSGRSIGKNNKDPSSVLLSAARQLERQSPKQQSAFLDAALRHHRLLSLSPSPSPSSPKEIPKGSLIAPQHIFRPSEEAAGQQRDSFAAKLKEAVSLKKLKKWKNSHSPCVIIVCISARRAVAVLKELSSLKLRMAKLFPKNGSVEEQKQHLASTSYGIAVGTPHRLNALLSSSPSSLTLDRTQLVVLDCHVSHKQYTVCTLPDTAPHCMGLLLGHVLPQLQNRKDLRVAFF